MAQTIDRALRKKHPNLKFNSGKWNTDRKDIMNRDKVLFHFERKGTYWGGSRPTKADADKRVWVGENILGKLIMNLE